MSLREEYVAYLQSDKWAKKRIEKATQVNYTCEKCGVKMLKGFNIHHKTYKHFGNEPLRDLMFLCPDCHKKITAKQKGKRHSFPKSYKPKSRLPDFFVCPYCKGNSYTIKRKITVNSIYYGIYCKSCGKWQKWLPKSKL